MSNYWDEDFHRDESAHDTWWGDPAVKGTPQATLGPIEKGSFYAIEVKSGTLSTKGGPKTNKNGAVLNVDGGVIKGLYAAGNVMTSPMGVTYGGAGGDLAPGMVFALLAERDESGRC